MLFNTLKFAIFFGIVYIIYLLLRHKWQNRLLLLASYVFYAFWDWRFLSLIILSTLFNYYFGLKIDSSAGAKERKTCLTVCVVLNLAMLGFFKYFNFFSENLAAFLGLFGYHPGWVALNIILPLGISFYTFQAMSYPIDIYRGVIRPTNNLPDFALFIAFFPQLVAGPIERARNLIPQIETERKITPGQFYHGSWLIFWGLFKKILVADNLAGITTRVFASPSDFYGGALLIAVYAFAFQVYADFSGYSDMARGIAKVMGFELILNFRTPFFSKDLFDFWQRWHISLTTWIKEYVYYPLALAKFWGRQLKAPFCIMLTWAIMGLWHGAAWKFVLWGVYHGALLVIYSRIRPYFNSLRLNERFSSGMWGALRTLLIFNLFSIGIVFFAVETTPEVFTVLGRIVVDLASPYRLDMGMLFRFLVLVVPFVFMERFQYKADSETFIFAWPALARGLLYFAILYSIILYGDFSAQRYYYFQF